MKIKFILVLVSVFFTLATQANPISCLKNKKRAPLKTSTKDQVADQIKKGLGSGNQKLLLDYASCDFTVGLNESNLGGVTLPENVIPKIAPRLKGAKWGQGEDYKTQFNVEALDSESKPTLIFRNDNKTEWYWAGYSQKDDEFIEKILATVKPDQNDD